MDPDRQLAAAAQSVEDDAFGLDGEAGERMVERDNCAADALVAVRLGEDGVAGCAGLKRERALAGCGA